MGTQITIVKNRTNKPFEFMYDGQVYIVPANGESGMLAEVAAHGMNQSVISYNPDTGAYIRALCKADAPEAEDEIEPRVLGSELIERQPGEKVEIKTFSNPDLRGARISSPLKGE